ncbi:MAG: S41 family peptidase [Longimicrobiales bacterium]
MKMKRTILTPVVVALVALGTGGWFLQKGADQKKNVYANSELFENVLREVQEKFVDAKDSGELYQKAIDGMLEELGDPHSVLMPAKEYERLRTDTEGQYGGIGIQIGKRGDFVTVISPLPGTPAERLGLRAGDAIIEVDGVSAKGWTDEMAMSKLRGPVGKPVKMTIARPGVPDRMPFNIVREEIHIRAVPSAFMVGNGVGYAELSIFSETSTTELRAALKKLQSEGAKSVILDLRNNPGGLLDQGGSVSDLFLERGDLVLETKSRVVGQSQKMLAVDADEFPNMPIVILVGPGTASAAEILAGALQDHDRALVLGRTTYGKGSVQTVIRLPDNKNYLKLTTARWYTPSGRSIQKPYGIGAAETPAAEGEDGSLTANDSTKDKPTFKTDGGRTVYGGGGIVPDLIVALDTITATERVFLQEVAKFGQQYATARLAFAVEYLRRTPNIQQGFVVTPQMVAEFYGVLQKQGVKVDRTVYNAASGWLTDDLAYEISYSKWGQQGTRQRVNRADPQVIAAAALLQRAKDPAALFTLAKDYAAKHKQPEPALDPLH